ncbi:hypothetical protein KAR91_68860, partial [Candidatus Pacearchaeota archaeon]|nr:hypothetical protein [Candidatus Pacearchaeota archaeon]
DYISVAAAGKSDPDEYREDDALLAKMAKEPKGHMVNCGSRSPYTERNKNGRNVRYHEVENTML